MNQQLSQSVKVSQTNLFWDILKQCEGSLLVSTYQAGSLMIFRHQRHFLNSHFRSFRKAMGVAANGQRVAIGTGNYIKEFYNMPALSPRLGQNPLHDACYLLRNTHVTGNIDIHEMDWAGDQLYFINTLFSCLCTLDEQHSFVPVWRPPFVSAFAPEDRCHLNGLAIVDHQPKYVSALGTGNSRQGWREHKRDGGIIMDISNNEFIVRGLCMPHSPRWYRDQLWVLESGKGSLATVDLSTGKLNVVTQVPGFTRGLDFYQNYAFIGLSKLRAKTEFEKSVFREIPLTEEFDERTCGVWIVDINTGETVAHVIFEEGVEEIFSVKFLPGICFPEFIDIATSEFSHYLGSAYALPEKILSQVGVS